MSLATTEGVTTPAVEPRHSWTRDEVKALFALP